MDSSIETATIYIRLLEEGTTCSRPTQALAMPDGSYKVCAATDYDPSDELWEFVPGSRVHCASVDGRSGPYLLAMTEVGVDGRQINRPRLIALEKALECRDGRGHLLWCLRKEEIVLVAEYTTAAGPFGDDWFLVFATANKITYFTTCPIYSDSRGAAEEFLSAQFSVELRLAKSTEWNSIVLWPKALEGRNLFEFSDGEPRNWRERLRAWCDGCIGESHVSNAVNQYLRSRSQL
jgi:hypothetical protein